MKASERIRNSIESQIRGGALLPGDPVDEERLMTEFGVSRTPVREALLQLRAADMVTALPRGGAVVSKLDVAQLFAMWELLADLEGLAARDACPRMSKPERQALADLHREAEAVVDSDDELGWEQANMRFHEMIYAGARNPYLRQEIMRMRTRTQAYRRHAFSAVVRLRVSYDGHSRIVDAILANDCAAAAREGFAHLNPGGSPLVTDLLMKLPRELLD
jgi:DNA-binding GntR family transcriptional regulator